MALYGHDGGAWGPIGDALAHYGHNFRQAQQRWLMANPACRRQRWTTAEDRALVLAQFSCGDRWAAVARAVVGRTPFACRERAALLDANAAGSGARAARSRRAVPKDPASRNAEQDSGTAPKP